MNSNQIHTKIWIHAIISTQNKLPLILTEYEKNIFKILIDCFKNQQCKVESINGIPDHVHVLFLIQSPSNSLNTIMQEVISESKLIINTHIYKAGSFMWRDFYTAFSVSQSQIKKVKEFIENQKNIHAEKTFLKEWNELIQLHQIG